jgi:hypothetical protein
MNFMPNGIYGWLGLGIIGATAAYHKELKSIGLIIGFGVGIYLYFVMDDQATSTATTTTS